MTTKSKSILSVEERRWKKQFRRKLKDKIQKMIGRRLDAARVDGEDMALALELDRLLTDKVMSEIMDFREIVRSELLNCKPQTEDKQYVRFADDPYYKPKTLAQVFAEQDITKRANSESVDNLEPL